MLTNTATRPALGARWFRRGAAIALAASVVAATPLPATAEPGTSTNNSSEKLRSAVTLDGVQRHLAAFQSHADAHDGHRYAGTGGHDDSAQYVFDQLQAAGYEPTFQEFEYDAFFERSPSELAQVSPTATTYVNGEDFRVMSYSGSGDVTEALATPTGAATGCAAADFGVANDGLTALVSRGACSFRTKVDNATAAGATAVLIYNNVPGMLNGTLGAGGLSAVPALGLTQELGQQLLASMRDGDVVMRARTDTGADRYTTRNVLAETPGGDPGNVVMAGAHLDSVYAGAGINDNGSGSAAVLETAIQMAGVNPRNKVRFAWWSAEESGLVGSNHYTATLPQAELDAIALYLNFDMVGSPNFVRFVYDGDNSTGTGAAGPEGSAAIEQLFVDYFASQGLASEPTPFNGRSDYGGFIAKGIPAGGLFTGAEGIKSAAQAETYGGTAGEAFDPCYHAACDTLANVDPTALDQMSDAVAHAVISYAQNTVGVNGEKGKGNFKPRPTGADNGTGDGGGGGLHEDHDTVEA